MKSEDLKPFLCHIQFDNDPEDVGYDYSYPDKYTIKVEEIKCRVLDGPFAGKTAVINVEEEKGKD